MKRVRQLLTVLIGVSLVLSAVPAPAAAVFHSDSGTVDVIEYSTGPSYVVELRSNSDLDKLRSWSNESGRQLVEYDHETELAIVSGPKAQIDNEMSFLERVTSGAIFADPLGDRLYVKDVSPNYRLSIPEPVESTDLTNRTDFEAPESAESGLLSSEDMPHEGMAFSEDANRTTMSESRSSLGVDNVSVTGANETIAVIDTGANTADGRVFGNGSGGSSVRILNSSKNMISNESVNGSDYSAVEDGSDSRHGTWVASAAAANVSGTTHDGIAPDADLLVLKALGDDGSGSTANIAQAIRYASLRNASVISMSLGSPVYSESLDRAISTARDRGSVVVVAAGNSRQSVRWLASPADSEDAIAVGATNGETPSNASSAYFSQIGPDPGTTDDSEAETAGATVDVAAPGMETVAKTVSTGGVVSNKTLSGTSMATPMVSGALALAIGANDWSTDETYSQVEESARPIPSAGETEVGSGMVAADHLVDETSPDTSQSGALTDGAETRDETYRAMSDSSGGTITRLLS